MNVKKLSDKKIAEIECLIRILQVRRLGEELQQRVEAVDKIPFFNPIALFLISWRF